MTSKNSLEINGKLYRNPFAELLAEIAQIKIGGSLRISKEKQKIIIYFEKGVIVFAVSNSREHRLFEILLSKNKITKQKLSQIQNFTNDFYLAKELVKQEIYTKENVDTLFTEQIEQILKNALEFNDGDWTFSSLVRIKDGISFDVDITQTLYTFGQTLEEQSVLERFKSFDEHFWLNSEKLTTAANFSPQEGFILSRMSENPLSVDDLKSSSRLDSKVILNILYKLWLCGFIFRGKWNSAFSTDDLSKINSASFTLTQSAKSVDEELKKAEDEKELEEEKAAAGEAKKQEEKEKAEEKQTKELELSLEEYIERIDRAATHYEIFNVAPNATVPEIKQNYFALAKKFHPDLFHKKVEPEMLTKIQHAFTEIAQAYETLKDEEAREVYDFKLRKVLEKLKIERTDDSPTISKKEFETSNQASMASDNFDHGYDHLMNAEYEDALPYLGRAVHLESDNARYHAFYGKALSFDKSKRHTAETELQTAVKLDPDNTVYRIMLAELFIEIGLNARAKGELNRLLKIAPKNKEAQSMLDRLPDK